MTEMLAREREFHVGEQVLILLPDSSDKLLAQCQGPYSVKRKVIPVTYEIDMHDKHKKAKSVSR